MRPTSKIFFCHMPDIFMKVLKVTVHDSKYHLLVTFFLGLVFEYIRGFVRQ